MSRPSSSHLGAAQVVLSGDPWQKLFSTWTIDISARGEGRVFGRRTYPDDEGVRRIDGSFIAIGGTHIAELYVNRNYSNEVSL